MRQVFKFQMVWSNNPLTIAEVYAESDADTFRSNPEWYEIKEESSSDKQQEEVKKEPAKKPGRPSKKAVPSEE
jgi:hypothetical protein